VARGLGSVETESTLLPRLAELSSDDTSKVRLAVMEAAVQVKGFD
jgi:hypothetical protein